ncbi:Myc-type basic helix-loop-helix (bHLH) domain-containing protein [Dioscorea alata]|uniref:Myc-type basic helix-loop-helix (BHLH) domain-containing protein n=1 Tax=Dioscorea alata TaxID=55571 RepID=A0ACB7UD71_DIOAL|nr:Myc-type basic helix-loop-helix (bHLH) domain-containing protein [Dioscorea alata]
MMNRSVFQSSSSCLWSSINPSSSTPPSLFSSSSSSSSSSLSHHSSLPSTFLPFSQLLLGGGEQMVDEEERYFVYGLHDDHDHQVFGIKGVKSYGDHEEEEDEIIHATTTTTTTTATSSCSQPLQSLSSPKSCVTTLDFSKRVHDSECNSREGGVALKKAKVQSSSSSSSTSSQASLKVRKEKLGDRVAALHQLVSPFGKTDTASVLQEAIGYIRFLHSQIEALTSPYIATASSHPVQGERNCIFIEDSEQGSNEGSRRDLKSRGLCLVPVSITPQIGSENGADFWAPSCCGSSV